MAVASSQASPHTVGSLVSVVVTTRDNADTIEQCLRSVRGQTYPRVELVVVDNASTDGTAAIAERYADRLLHQGPERSAQRNAGVAAARGSYVLVVDSDMALGPEVVAECVRASVDAGGAAVIVPEWSFGRSLLARAKALERNCYVGDDLIEAPRFFARDVYLAYGGYDEEITGAEDWDLPARMRADVQFARIDARITHDEGELRLVPHLRKKFYYGRGIYRYARAHPGLVARQAVPFRSAWVRNWRTLAGRPLLTATMVGLKLAETVALAGGAVVEARAARRRRRVNRVE